MRSPRNVICRSAEFAIQLIESAGKNSQFLHEAGPAAKDNIVQDSVPRRRTLRHIAAEEFRIQGLHRWNFANIARPARQGFAKGNQRSGKPRQKSRRHGNLLASAHEFAVGPQAERVIQGDAGHGKGRLPVPYDGVEDIALFARKSANPVITYTAPGRARCRVPESPAEQTRLPQADRNLRPHIGRTEAFDGFRRLSLYFRGHSLRTLHSERIQSVGI
jgi:hypothetical protein